MLMMKVAIKHHYVFYETFFGEALLSFW